jgi:leucyl-tRNA synthetase
MKRYSKLQTKKIVKKDKEGNFKSVVLPDGKSYYFDKPSKKWVLIPPVIKKKKLHIPKNGPHYDTLRKNATTAERAFRSLLRNMGMNHEFQKPVKVNNGYRYIDFYFPHIRLAIEIDGGYHNDPSQQIKDHEREKEIIDKLPVTFIRFTNQQVLNNPEVLIDALFGYVKQKYIRKGIILSNEF